MDVYDGILKGFTTLFLTGLDFKTPNLLFS